MANAGENLLYLTQTHTHTPHDKKEHECEKFIAERYEYAMEINKMRIEWDQSQMWCHRADNGRRQQQTKATDDEWTSITSMITCLYLSNRTFCHSKWFFVALRLFLSFDRVWECVCVLVVLTFCRFAVFRFVIFIIIFLFFTISAIGRPPHEQHLPLKMNVFLLVDCFVCHFYLFDRLTIISLNKWAQLENHKLFWFFFLSNLKWTNETVRLTTMPNDDESSVLMFSIRLSRIWNSLLLFRLSASVNLFD